MKRRLVAALAGIGTFVVIDAVFSAIGHPGVGVALGMILGVVGVLVGILCYRVTRRPGTSPDTTPDA
jgi:multisubunit Na+/H+ antiporter MnhB subunit